MKPLPRRCPLEAAPAHAACPDRACPADPGTPLPRRGTERALVLALRFVAAAAETGDAACFDAAFAEAEAVFGLREGASVVGRVAGLLRAARRDAVALDVLPPACRFLSRDESSMLAGLRAARSGQAATGGDAMPSAMRLALVDLARPLQAGPAQCRAVDWKSSDVQLAQFPAILS